MSAFIVTCILCFGISARFLGWLRASAVTLLAGAVCLKLQAYVNRSRTHRLLRERNLNTWPSVSGKLPGNIDIMYEIGKGAATSLPGQGFADLSKRYGPTYDLRPMGNSMVYTQDPDLVRHILAVNPQNYVKGQFANELFKDVLGTGIFNSDGERWKGHRQAARPFFARENLTNFVVFEKHCNSLLKVIDTLSGPDARFPAAIEFHDLAARFTLDSASDFLFGESVHCMSSLESGTGDPPYLAAFQRVQRRLSKRILSGSWWKWLERGRDMDNDMQIVRQLVDGAVAKAANSKEATYNGFTTLLEMITKEGVLDAKAKTDEMLNVLMAARDTTASLIASTMYELASNPDIQDAARQEVLNFVGAEDHVSFQDVKNLKTLRAVLNETLRMYPPITANHRVALDDDVAAVSGRKLHIPAGTHIACGVFQMQRRQDLWGEDAHVWRPQRWMDSKGIPAQNGFAFQAWGVGPRICIGQELAYLEATYLISRFLQTFDQIDFASDAQPAQSWIPDAGAFRIMPEAPVVTLTLRGGVWLRFRKNAGVAV